MPSSSTNYSYNIPTVGSDSTTYGTIINQFVNSLATKLKAVSDAINTAGVGASSTLAQINRNIAQVDAINSRLPAGVADLLPDPYSGATTPVSTWPYLNTELTAEGFSPPTTAQEVLDFDYEGFASYLNTRFDSLSARIVGLDAPITIADSSTLVCETNAILDTIGTYKTVTTTNSVDTVTVTPIRTIPVYMTWINLAYAIDNELSAVIPDLVNVTADVKYSDPFYLFFNQAVNTWKFQVTATDVTGRIAAGEKLDTGNYLQDTTHNTTFEMTIYQYGKYFQTAQTEPDGTNISTTPYLTDVPGGLADWFGSSFPAPTSGAVNFSNSGTLEFLKVVRTQETTTVSNQVKKTINDVDFSGCT